LQKTVEMIVETANDILEKIADFKIEINATDKTIEFYVIDYPMGTDESRREVLARMCSGYQKFIIDLVFRISFIKNMKYLPKFLIIDEGFGSLDKDNQERIKEILIQISENPKIFGLDFMIIVTHLNEYQGLTDKNIDITQIGEDTNGEDAKFSRVQYGERVDFRLLDEASIKTYKEKATPDQADIPVIADGEARGEYYPFQYNNDDNRWECQVCNRKLSHDANVRSMLAKIKKHCDTNFHKDRVVEWTVFPFYYLIFYWVLLNFVDLLLNFVDLLLNFVDLLLNFVDLLLNFVDLLLNFIDLFCRPFIKLCRPFIISYLCF